MTVPTVLRPRTNCCPTWPRGWRSAASRRRRWQDAAGRARCSSASPPDVDVTRRDVADYHAPQPLPVRRTRGDRERLAPSRRDAALDDVRPPIADTCWPRPAAGRSGCWLDARCAELVRTRARLRTPRRPPPTRQHPQALMTDDTLALDVGGTKIAAGLVDADGTLVHRAQQPTPDARRRGGVGGRRDADRRRAARGRAGRVAGVGHRRRPARSTCRAAPSARSTSLRGNAFRSSTGSRQLTGLPVRLGGDGLCMALGERWRGAGRGAQFLLGMVVSTGIGGGLVLDGAPYDGRTGNAGHVGHVVVEPDGRAVHVRWPRLRRDRRLRTAPGAVGARQRLGRGRRTPTRRNSPTPRPRRPRRAAGVPARGDRASPRRSPRWPRSATWTSW